LDLIRGLWAGPAPNSEGRPLHDGHLSPARTTLPRWPGPVQSAHPDLGGGPCGPGKEEVDAAGGCAADGLLPVVHDRRRRTMNPTNARTTSARLAPLARRAERRAEPTSTSSWRVRTPPDDPRRGERHGSPPGGRGPAAPGGSRRGWGAAAPLTRADCGQVSGGGSPRTPRALRGWSCPQGTQAPLSPSSRGTVSHASSCHPE